MEEIKLVGSEQLYNRVNKKLANLEIDTVFHNRQLELFIWRVKLLKKNIAWRYQEQLAFLATKKFFTVLEILEKGPVSKTLYLGLPLGMPLVDMEVGREAVVKFKIPLLTVSLITSIYDHASQEWGQCECRDCRRYLSTVRKILPLCYPRDTLSNTTQRLESAVKLTEDYINKFSNYCREPRSLIELCVIRVAQFGLDDNPDLNLPHTLKQSLVEGLLVRRSPRGDGLLDQLHRVVKDVRATMKQTGLTHLLISQHDPTELLKSDGSNPILFKRRI